MARSISFYNESLPNGEPVIDRTQISWTRGLKKDFEKKRAKCYFPSAVRTAIYRPFTKCAVYFDRDFNEYVNQIPKFFPEAAKENRVIVLPGPGEDRPFSAQISNVIPDLHFLHGGQCFPLYLYDKAEEGGEDELFAKGAGAGGGKATRRDGISDAGLAHFQAAYPAKGEGGSITKEDLFYYIYGLLHSPDYRSRYADNLGKELPRIPAVKTFADFRAYSQAGRELAHWHLNYETVAPYAGAKLDTGKTPRTALTDADYRVTKMKFAKTKTEGKSVADKTTVIYNERITITCIPLAAYDYVVNGKPALEWVMERQSVTTDKDSGIVNDANLWATETMQNAKYPLELFLRVITVSLETMKIVNGLPPLGELK